MLPSVRIKDNTVNGIIFGKNYIIRWCLIKITFIADNAKKIENSTDKKRKVLYVWSKPRERGGGQRPYPEFLTSIDNLVSRK